MLSLDEFFPLQKGFYQIYDVEEIKYSAFNPPESLSYELKSEIVDSFSNSEGGTTFVIHRSTRADESSSWEYQATWSARADGQNAVVNEGNIPFVKFILPLAIKSTWNGNMFNTLGEDNYILENYVKTYTVETGPSFDQSIIVNQNDESNLVNRDQRIEVYSANRGLVFKESQVWNYNCTGGNCTGQIVSGFYIKQTLKDHGQN